ncbi:acylphosphatase [Alteribacter keqinensis]|uniref:Acylphosphatase n=1 Tax=Alteribacter keqinensis TaxID=2483800 RepID=A0A3M7TQP9_9BACI|nr:acylphosphatase [Alteribacter keqinensis]RNA67587.1 ATP-grasp domain-containing protein [Alteribacter keqinensis]
MSNKWLKHLKNSIPESAFGYKLCIYTIALEGWRRGLDLTFFNIYRKEKGDIKLTVRFSLSNGTDRYDFAVSRGGLVSREAIDICIDKDKTKHYLEKANVPVPTGKSFGANDSDQEIVDYFKTLDYPVVLKPTDAGGGKGVITNIKNNDELMSAIKHVRHELNYKDVILERFIVGRDHRVYVVGNEVIGVYKRINANVIGNGKDNIDKLIDQKNKERKKNPYLSGRLIKKDKEMYNYLSSKGMSLESVPDKGKRIIIREKGSLSAGGEPIDVTEDISYEAKQTAIQAANAIPGLPQCAVDMIIDEKSEIAVVNEVNSKPQISNHLYPVEGVARDIPKAIIDFYFPETKETEINTSFYFDFDSIIPVLRNGNMKEVAVPKMPSGKIVSTRFRVNGVKKRLGFNRWVKRTAHGHKLHGRVKSLKDGGISIIVAGRQSYVTEFKNQLNKELASIGNDITVNEFSWKKPVKVGFEIENIKKTSKSTIVSLEEKIARLEEVNMHLVDVQKDYNKIIESRTWKATSPIRKLGDSLKK